MSLKTRLLSVGTMNELPAFQPLKRHTVAPYPIWAHPNGDLPNKIENSMGGRPMNRRQRRAAGE